MARAERGEGDEGEGGKCEANNRKLASKVLVSDVGTELAKAVFAFASVCGFRP